MNSKKREHASTRTAQTKMESPPSKPPAHGFAISHASPVPTTLSVPNTPASSNSRMDLLFAAGELLSPNGSNCDGCGENNTEFMAMDATTISAQEENAKQIPLVPMCVSQDSDVKQPLSAISRTGETSLLPTTTKEPRRRPIKQKRGPGRPRKHPLPESNAENALSVPPKKRGPGRPRTHRVPDALGQTATKTGPARPRKQGTETSKRGPGRPRKHRGPGRPRKHPLPAKRGPGRPRKHPSPKKKHELPVFGPARRVGRPFKVPVLVSEFLPPEQEQEEKPPAEAEPEKPVVRKLTRKGRPQKIPLHLNDMVHCVGKKPTCNWMKLAPGDILKQQSSLRASTSSSHARADLEFTPVEERVMDDGSMLPKREPKTNPDGTYIRPVGRAPPGTIWEKYRGLWVPYSNLKYGECTVAPKNQTPDSVSESNVKGSSLSECAVEQAGIASSHETTRVEDENAGS